MDVLLGFIIAGIALTGSPGPNTLSLAATGAAFGIGRGVAYLIGIVLGMVAVMAIVASGVTGMLLAVPGAAPVLIGLAAAYFVYLAWRIATAPPLGETSVDAKPPSLWAGAALSLINPKGYAAMAALFSGFVLAQNRPGFDIALKLVILTVVMILVDIAWLLLGAAMTAWFRQPRLNRIINIGFAVLLLASLLPLLL
jgi:threonine/homoserine/homoserine lactone efflux protein